MQFNSFKRFRIQNKYTPAELVLQLHTHFIQRLNLTDKSRIYQAVFGEKQHMRNSNDLFLLKDRISSNICSESFVK